MGLRAQRPSSAARDRVLPIVRDRSSSSSSSRGSSALTRLSYEPPLSIGRRLCRGRTARI
jgi:hypothetical protein